MKLIWKRNNVPRETISASGWASACLIKKPGSFCVSLAKPLLDRERIGMKRTRDEVASLIKRSEKNLKESRLIHHQLQLLMTDVDRVLTRKIPVKRKAGK